MTTKRCAPTSIINQLLFRKWRIQILAAMFLLGGATGWAATTNFTTAGTYSWTVPAGVTTVTVECWGGGGAGGSAKGSTTARGTGGGGAGGSYAKSVITVVPNNSYTITVGGGGVTSASSAVPGGDSWFNTSGAILAQGGAGGQSVTVSGSTVLLGAGGTGSLSSSVGDTKFKGGDGYTSPDAVTQSAGGGGSAGTGSDGTNAISKFGATAAPGGGAGGNGPSSSGASGSDGTAPGGGGGGAWASASTLQRNGGAGAAGKVSITYTIPAPTYTWVATSGSNDWTAASSWSPNRTAPAINDVLLFNNGGSSTATNVLTQTIGKLQVSANTVVTLQPTNGANMLTIGETAADALTVASGSQLNIFGATDATNLTINVAAGAKGSISGAMTLDNNFVSGTSFAVTASDASGITFNSGAVFTQNCPGNIFGSGTANSVVFASGSTFAQKFGSNPFQKTQPNSVVVFQTGSLFSVQGSTVSMSFAGRTYADLEINRTNFNDTASGSTTLTVSNLNVLQGTLAVSMSGGFNLLGNVVVASGAALKLNNSATNANGKTFTVNGTLGGTGTNYGNATILISPAGTLAPGASSSTIGSLTFATPPTLNGTNYAKIDRNAGSPLADKLIVTSGTLAYDGTLVVTNIGSTLQVNDTFTLFSAPAYAASAFSSIQLPDGFTWDTSALTNNGTIRVSAISGAPTSEPITIQTQSGQLIMNWSQAAFALASSTNVAGPFEKILGATSPYTNATTSATLFFKLVYP